MTRGSFYSQFKTEFRPLISAVEGRIDLDIEYPDLYRKVVSYYTERDVYFHEDDRDYNTIMDQLEYDLLASGVSV
tara:strand:+ start:637 stop:861 length:225 start_codon:yes stop_codon:yes gene_type:complete